MKRPRSAPPAPKKARDVIPAIDAQAKAGDLLKKMAGSGERATGGKPKTKPLHGERVDASALADLDEKQASRWQVQRVFRRPGGVR